MNQMIKGILTVVAVAILTVIFSILIGAIVAVMSINNPWMGMTGAMITVFVGGALLLGLLIMGIFRYQKDKSEYWLGVIYGVLGLVGLNIILAALGWAMSLLTAF
ncbi:MAG: hypothetical protein UMR38_01640 [Candidatus Izemoplasma sp.]|nr:hypothetical protein [Candidatus Izemoplasma sp.]